jgi:serine/threonine protein kinase
MKCGTPGYIAPEIFYMPVLLSQTPALDIFSASIIMYNLLVGESLFEGED